MSQCIRRTPAYLVLADGRIFHGFSAGAEGEVVGQAVFATGMTGYQHMLTDPATRGDIVAFTYPLIGNCGVSRDHMQSGQVHAAALVAGEIARYSKHHQSSETLADYLKRHDIIAIEGVDTRALTRHLVQRGPMQAVAAAGADIDVAQLTDRVGGEWREPLSPVMAVTTDRPYEYASSTGPHAVVMDLGVRKSTLAALESFGCRVTVQPAGVEAAAIKAARPDLVVVAGGPGLVHDVSFAVDVVQELLTDGPLLGIGLGHLVVGTAMGARAAAMPHGHRGSNVPVKDVSQNRVYITSQYHGEALVPGSWSDPDLRVSHVHVDDGTVEGLAHAQLPIKTVQFYPEGAPGPSDTRDVYADLLNTILGLRV